MLKISKKVIKAIKNLEWSIREYDDYYEIETWSPAGENLIETIYKDKDIVEQFWEIYYNFDEEEHVEMWAGARGKVGGVPSIITLVCDAEKISEMYKQLALAVEKACKGALRC